MENIGRDGAVFSLASIQTSRLIHNSVAKIRRAFARLEKYLPELARTICDFTELGESCRKSLV